MANKNTKQLLAATIRVERSQHTRNRTHDNHARGVNRKGEKLPE